MAVAERSKAGIIFVRTNPKIVGSNLVRSKDICVWLLLVLSSMYVEDLGQTDLTPKECTVYCV
jgi:hypothetical protein